MEDEASQSLMWLWGFRCIGTEILKDPRKDPC